MEERYGSSKTTPYPTANNVDENEDESSSDEEEDDDGILASGILDEQVNATLQAIRKKDPRVYDVNATFYTSGDPAQEETQESGKKKQKPMYLSDYHRENLLRGDVEKEEEEEEVPRTYAQEQDELKKVVVQEMHAAAEGSGSSDVDDDSDGFLVKKAEIKGRKHDDLDTTKAISAVDVESADRNPEAFLSKFMSARAWVPSGGTSLHPFESDDDEDDQRAEEFEQAYNLRFENPEGANEKLMTHARDTAAKYSVRKEETNKRKRAREADQAKKETVKQERQEEKARLRKLRLDEAKEKIKRIKEASGLKEKQVKVDEWANFLLEDWDDERWETEMKKKFGDDYYAGEEVEADSDETGSKKSKLKKPKWDDDIDINDLVPDFDDERDIEFSLSEDEIDDEAGSSKIKQTKKLKKQEKEEKKRESRRERRKLEQLVDEKLDLDMALNGTASKSGPSGRFRYRDTSPTAFGLTPQDILLASDSQLNQFAGLKKMAAFRDAEKKRKDKKQLSKKARLRQWRKDTFGDERGPRKTLQDVLREGYEAGGGDEAVANSSKKESANGIPDIREGKKRKRSKRAKQPMSQ